MKPIMTDPNLEVPPVQPRTPENIYDETEITVEGTTWIADSYYIRWFIKNKDKIPGTPHVRCGKCFNSLVRMEYGDYECIAVCQECGHRFTIYDG